MGSCWSCVRGLDHLRLGDRLLDLGLQHRGPCSVGLRLVLRHRGLGRSLHVGHRGLVWGQRRLGLDPTLDQRGLALGLGHRDLALVLGLRHLSVNLGQGGLARDGLRCSQGSSCVCQRLWTLC